MEPAATAVHGFPVNSAGSLASDDALLCVALLCSLPSTLLVHIFPIGAILLGVAS